MEVTRQEHQIWKEMANQELFASPFPPMVGKWQYIAKSDKGEISIVELPDYFKDGKTLWEIYCLKGNLFDDVERFDSYEDAYIAAGNYLEISK